MYTVIEYKTPDTFIEASIKLLMSSEMANNVLISLAYGFMAKQQEHPQYRFITIIDNAQQMLLAAINSKEKLFLSNNTADEKLLVHLITYCNNHNIIINGLLAKKNIAAVILPLIKKRYTVLFTLPQMLFKNGKPPVTKVNGNLQYALITALPLLVKYALQFQQDAQLINTSTEAQLTESIQNKINYGYMYCWMVNGEVVSMAALVRRTKNIAVIGLVYTPDKYRGNGYASHLVYEVSNALLEKKFKQVVLFTDKANKTSNHIYEQIGYTYQFEFLDVAINT
jgi:uncharacterized protein